MDMITKLLPSGMLVAYILKMLYMGSVDFAETGIVFSLTALVVLLEYFNKHTTIQQMDKKIQDIAKTVDKQNLVIKEMAEEVSSLKTNVTASRLQQGIKNVKI